MTALGVFGLAQAAAFAFYLIAGDAAFARLDHEAAIPTQARAPRSAADRQARAVAHARNNIAVVMYSTAWCPACKAARAYMNGKGIAYVDNDVDESASARETLQRLNPRGSIPTIDVDGEVMVGFGAEHFEAMLDRAARKRAGI
jgi:glutaredoxin